ncbi:MAG: class I mannose-6-phosphate isomerase [Anaerolineae bacterium]|nr:class I mannose-6-phosphate isomerase [Anaerolineae bacterium]
MTGLYPLLFEPVLKDYLWGGRNLEALGRKLPPAGVVAESWEIAAHEDGATIALNGAFAGRKLTEIQAELGLGLIGARNRWAQERGKFPLLIKLLDAAQPLSVQVHPDDAYALEREGNELGKTEMWVVLAARPGAELILGVKAGATREAFRAALLAGRPEPLLHRLPVKPGDHLCVPAGAVHAIMDGLLIAEIQQNSNTTYRVFDWNRVGADGRPRALHIDKALDVIDFSIVEPQVCLPEPLSGADGCARFLLCRNRYFVTERVELAPGAIYHGRCDGSTLEVWGVIAGEANVGGEALDAVRFALLPAALGDFAVTTRRGATLLRSYVE